MDSGSGRWRVVILAAFVACGGWLVLNELWIVALGGRSLGGRSAHVIVLLISAALCLARGFVRREQRLAWCLIGLGVLAWAFGELYYSAVLWTQSNPPIPSPADGGYLLFAPLCLAGLIVLLRGRAGGLPIVLWIDGLTTALSVGALSAALVFEQTLSHESGTAMTVATALAYPLGDMILLAAVFGALARMGWRADRVWVLLGGGILMFLLADSLYTVATAAGTYQEGSWFDTGWWGGLYLIAAAGWMRPSPSLARRSEATVRAGVTPLLFGVLGLGLLIYSSFQRLNALAVMLAAASLGGVMVRLVLAFRENVAMLRHSRGEALTDPLTGLANRRALTSRLDELLSAPAAGQGISLVMFDLDGFKHYNDTFGHPSGDALLIRLAEKLEARLKDRGQAFRMGGDEFCALITQGGQEGERLASWAAGALAETGEGFVIGCSHGQIELPGEAQDASEALRIADQRMYAQKHDRRASAPRQIHDALLRVVVERNGELGEHGTAVAWLAELTAQGLGLAAEQVAAIRQAAELHDIGKVAIPDAILNKPGPLTEQEWVLMRSHTCLGERILASAPALTEVAQLVRHSHERWDGAGYPDRLTGAEIPIGSRVIAVADAFDAMTQARPYGQAISSSEALAELQRCEGSQFDPVVVKALTSAIDHHTNGAVLDALSASDPAYSPTEVPVV